MEDYNGYETVKERLILTGIGELQKHSVADLSLRKVSALCNVSSAAPYKHFKNKDDFVRQIMDYINCQWTRLRSQIIEAYAPDEKTQLIEVCIAYVKFCMANASFRNIMVMKTDRDDAQPTEEQFYFSPNENLIRKYCQKKFRTEALVEQKIFAIHAIVYGTVYMLDKAYMSDTKASMELLRASLERELE